MSGWISISRNLLKHPIFHKRPDRVYAWIWMLEKAAWKTTKFDVGGEIIEVKRGDFCASQATICAGTGLTRQALRTFMNTLEKEKMTLIRPSKKTTKSATIVTICNYDKYQAAQPRSNQATTKEQPTKEQVNNITTTLAKANDGNEAVDVVEIVWTRCKDWLVSQGTSDGQARSLIGKWLKFHTAAEVREAFKAAFSAKTRDPVPYITKTLEGKAEATIHPTASDIWKMLEEKKAAEQ